MSGAHRRPVLFTPKEDALLRRHYPGAGYRACREYLPGRSDTSIETRARTLKLPGPKGPLSAAGLESRRLKSRATRQKKKDNPERAERRCLGPCGQMFVSEHIGHRMCKTCRGYAERMGFDTVRAGI